MPGPLLKHVGSVYSLGTPGVAGSLVGYFVSTAGNDTSGDGSRKKPWRTISKALATVPVAGGFTIWVAAGTYVENTGGLNYLRILKLYTNWVTVSAFPGASVTITDNGSGTFTLVYAANTGRVKFRNINFLQAGNNTQGTVFLQNGSESAFSGGIIYTRNWCVYTTPTGAISLSLDKVSLLERVGEVGNICCLYSNSGAGGNTNLVMTDCTISGRMTSGNAVVYLSVTNATGTFTAIVSGGTLSNTGTGNYTLNAVGGSLSVVGAVITGIGSPAAVFGTDGATTYTTTGSITQCIISSISSHALLIGQGCSAVSATYNTITSGDYGIVCKVNVNCVADYNTISGTSAGALYFKGAVGSFGRYNQLSAATGLCVQVGENVATKCQNITLTNNVLNISGTADCFFWSDTTGDAGGGICDYNTYHLAGSGDIGSVWGTSNIVSLGALQAAWATYDVPTNDEHSIVS